MLSIPELIGSPRDFPAELASDLVREIHHIDTSPKTIVDADRAQQQLLAIFERHRHGAGAFLKVYHGVTVAVIDALKAGSLSPCFFFERLAGKFAERHFDGVKAALGLDTSSDAAKYELWTPSFSLDNMNQWSLNDSRVEALRPDECINYIRRGRLPPRTLLALKAPLINFLIGMSCHINFDLAVALDEVIREFKLEEDTNALRGIERGHNFVDSILERRVDSSMGMLAEEMCPLAKTIIDADAVPLATGFSMGIIRQWRSRTFPNGVRLATAASPGERERYRAKIYRDGWQTTTALFNLLPDIIRLFLNPNAGKALPPTMNWLYDTRIAGTLFNLCPHDIQSLLDPAEMVLAAAAKGLRGAHATIRFFNLLLRMQFLNDDV